MESGSCTLLYADSYNAFRWHRLARFRVLRKKRRLPSAQCLRRCSSFNLSNARPLCKDKGYYRWSTCTQMVEPRTQENLATIAIIIGEVPSSWHLVLSEFLDADQMQVDQWTELCLRLSQNHWHKFTLRRVQANDRPTFKQRYCSHGNTKRQQQWILINGIIVFQNSWPVQQ